jgi:hypothetical protein
MDKVQKKKTVILSVIHHRQNLLGPTEHSSSSSGSGSQEWLTYTSTTPRYSETSVDFRQTTRRHILEDRTLNFYIFLARNAVFKELIVYELDTSHGPQFAFHYTEAPKVATRPLAQKSAQ